MNPDNQESNSQTPRTDAELADFTVEDDGMVCPDFARQLEIELNEAKSERDMLRDMAERFEKERDQWHARFTELSKAK